MSLPDTPPSRSGGAATLLELPALTGIRGFAALWVLLFHAWGLSGAPHLVAEVGPLSFGLSYFCTMGWAGVDIFFTLSAFLLVLPFAAWQLGAGPRPPLPAYFLRRVLRIFPAYYAQLLALLLLALLFGIAALPTTGQLLAHLLLWLDMDWFTVAPLNGVWWTLPLEFSFYLVLPLLALLLRPRWLPLLVLGAIVVACGYRVVEFHAVATAAHGRVLQHLAARIDQFVLGMLAGYLFVAAILRGKPLQAGAANLLFGLALAGLVLLRLWLRAALDDYWNGAPIFWLWHTLAALCIALGLYAAARGAGIARPLFANRPMRLLGEISFGLYLWHFPVLAALAPWLAPIDSPDLRYLLLLALGLPATVLVAWLSWSLIERRCLRLGRPRGAHPAQQTLLPQAVSPG